MNARSKLPALPGLPFAVLREANMRRLPEFKNKHGKPAHSEPDGSDWTLDQWFQAYFGEMGEYANVRKKRDRGDIAQAEYIVLAGKELADCITYLDIAAFRARVDLGAAVALVSNDTDKRTRTPVILDGGETRDQLSAMTFDRLAVLEEPFYTNEGSSIAGAAAAQDFIGALYQGAEAAFLAGAHYDPSALGKCLGRATRSLCILAWNQGIDLGAQTVAKFNEVSLRVQCGIQIAEIDGQFFVDVAGAGQNPAPAGL